MSNTSSDDPRPEGDVSQLARASGGLAMVALDQRESMRTMFADSGAGAVDDDVLADFKGAAAEPSRSTPLPYSSTGPSGAASSTRRRAGQPAASS